MLKNVTPDPVGASPNVLDALTDSALDQKIVAKIQMIGSALKGRDRAIAEIEKCEKSAVQSAWRLGQFLIEKKKRMVHGEWGAWLSTLPHVSPTSATNFMRLAREIGSAADLKSSIRATLRALPEPTTATPKSAPTTAVKIVEPEPVEPTEPDSAAVINDLEGELYDAQERVAIMEESTDPKSRKVIDKLNNQAELIRTLKASVADWQSKASAARKENGSLKRRIKALETELDRRRPRHTA